MPLKHPHIVEIARHCQLLSTVSPRKHPQPGEDLRVELTSTYISGMCAMGAHAPDA